eukprot:357500-Chlamydomonas_euryale.AAC.17
MPKSGSPDCANMPKSGRASLRQHARSFYTALTDASAPVPSCRQGGLFGREGCLLVFLQVSQHTWSGADLAGAHKQQAPRLHEVFTGVKALHTHTH